MMLFAEATNFFSLCEILFASRLGLANTHCLWQRLEVETACDSPLTNTVSSMEPSVKFAPCVACEPHVGQRNQTVKNLWMTLFHVVRVKVPCLCGSKIQLRGQ